MNTITKDVITKFNNRDEAGYKHIFYCLLQELHAYSMTITRDYHESEDIVLRVFLTLWECDKKFETETDIRSFMYTCVKNKSLDHVSTSAFKARLKTKDDTHLELTDTHDDYDEEKVALMYKFIQTLPPQCKDIIIMKLNGLTTDEISAKLKINEQTVYTQVRRAIKKIKDNLSRM